MSLDGPWGFSYDDANRGLDEHWQDRADVYTRTIQVPFPPESSASGIGDTDFHPIVWYRRTFQMPEAYEGRRLLLHCGAVDYRASVWLNGQLVITHEGGHTPFFTDITTALSTGMEQVLVIRAEDIPGDLAQPRGKQDWQEQPHGIWYQRTTGIWQPVWLEPVSSVHILQLRWTPDLDRGTLGMILRLENSESFYVRIRLQLILHDTIIVDDIYQVQGTELQRQIAIDRAGMMNRDQLLWSPAHPNLIHAKVSILIDGHIVDEVHSYVGLRNVGVERGRFMLNGRPYYLRFVLQQGYWPQTHLAAPDDEALRREVELIKELGFNGVRLHQKVEDPRFLYWCDRLGLLVWGEMANAYIFTTTAMERFVREWMDVLARDYSHPCIVGWAPLNESWGVPNVPRDGAQRHFVQVLYHLTKALDPTRPTIANDGWEHFISDIYSVHDYSFDGEILRERYGSIEAIGRTLDEVQPSYRFVALPGYQHTNEPIMLTEFGGISYHPHPGAHWYGYGTVQDRDAFLDKYRELVEALLDSPAVAGFCYTQLTDTEQESNGLLTANREPKLDPAAVRAITQRASAAIPGDLISHMQKKQDITSFAAASLESTGGS